MYFGKFDKIQYNGKTVTNITSSILLKYRPMNNATLYTFHTVTEGETAEQIAHKYYGKATDHWIILLLNNIVDPYFDWVLSSQELVAKINSKYGDGLGIRIHHLFNLSTRKRVDDLDQAKYVDPDGILIVALPAHYHSVSNAEYESLQNDNRRELKILAPQYVQDFKNQFEDLMNREGLN